MSPGVWARRLSDTNGSLRWLVTGHPPGPCRPQTLTSDDTVPTLVSHTPACPLPGDGFIVQINLRVWGLSSFFECWFICPLRHNYDSDAAARTNWYNLEIFAFAVCSYFASMTNYGGKDSTLCIIILRISQNKFSSQILRPLQSSQWSRPIGGHSLQFIQRLALMIVLDLLILQPFRPVSLTEKYLTCY